MTLDLRPDVLKLLGAVRIEGESLDDAWENAEGDERDRAFEVLEREHWQSCTSTQEVIRILQGFPEDSQQLIALLCAEATGETHHIMTQRTIWSYLLGQTSRDDLDSMGGVVKRLSIKTQSEYERILARASLAYPLMDPTDNCILDAAWDAANNGPKGIRHKSRLQIALDRLIRPDGPLKLLVESPSRNSLSELLTRWGVARGCATKLFDDWRDT